MIAVVSIFTVANATEFVGPLTIWADPPVGIIVSGLASSLFH